MNIPKLGSLCRVGTSVVSWDDALFVIVGVKPSSISLRGWYDVMIVRSSRDMDNVNLTAGRLTRVYIGSSVYDAIEVIA